MAVVEVIEEELLEATVFEEDANAKCVVLLGFVAEHAQHLPMVRA